MLFSAHSNKTKELTNTAKKICNSFQSIREVINQLSRFTENLSLIRIMNQPNTLKVSFCWLYGLLLLGLLALLRGNVNYIDDQGRAFFGYTGFEGFSRFASEYLSRLIHTQSFLADISPLPQLIAIGIVALASIFLIKAISGEKKFTLWQLLATLPLGLNPYFLECFSYKFDSPYMALSILAMVLPFCFYKKPLLFSIITTIGTLITCTSYQASTGIFLMILTFFCFSQWINGTSLKALLKLLFLGTLAFFLGLLIFKCFVMRPVDTYVSNTLPSLKELPIAFFQNMKHYFHLLRVDSPYLWKILSFATAAFFIIVSVFTSKQEKTRTFLLSIICLAAGILLTFGFYAMLKKPLYAPRAMYGIGVLLALFCVFIASHNKWFFVKIIPVCLSYCFLVYANAYGNALVVQNNFQKFHQQLLLTSLNTLVKNGTKWSLWLRGSPRHAPALREFNKHYPITSRLVPVTFGGRWAWDQCEITHYFGLKNVYVVPGWAPDKKYVDTVNQQKPIQTMETMFHLINLYSNNLVTVKFK